jgi:hypothetical protein
MRRYKLVPEEPQGIDPELTEFRTRMQILSPIRDHRLHKSERELRKEKQALKKIQQLIDEREVLLERRRQEQQQQRQELTEQHQHQKISQRSLKDWMGKEKQLLQVLDDINNELHTLHQSLEQQENQVLAAKKHVEFRHLENERLKVLSQKIEESW